MVRQRRERGEGAIFYSETRHRWVGQLDAGTNATGTRIRPIVVGCTREEARDKLTELRNARDKGIDIRARHATFAEIAELWLVRDVCAAYALCLTRASDLAPGTILNIASGTPRRIGDILTDLLAIDGTEAAIQTEDSRLRRSEIPLATGDAGLIRSLLGWAPSIPWDKTLADTLADWRGRVLAERD